MLLGPLFRVEMVSVARRRRYFLLRVVYGLLALFLLWTAYTSLQSLSLGNATTISIQQGARLATQFFIAFCWLQIIAVLTVGPALAVGTIATERERCTIEYLFTTDLSNAEIVLGKLAARLCLLGQLLLVGLPILFLFRLLGGIPAKLLVVTFLYAASSALLVASLSICVSVWSERSRDATVRVYLLLGVLILLPILLQAWGGMGFFRGALWADLIRPVLDFCISINPLWNLGMAIGNQNAIGARLDLSVIWQTVGRQLLVSLGAIGLAVFAVRRVHLKETTVAAGRQQKRRRQWKLTRWRRPLKSDAMVWKELFAATATTKLGFIGRVSVVLILITSCAFTVQALLQSVAMGNQYSFFMQYLGGFTGFLGTGILLMLAARAAGLVTSEKERDCWLSLLSTPLTGSQIMRAKLWGNLYSVRWPLLVLSLNWVLGILQEPAFVGATLLLLATFLMQAWYVSSVGLCFSLSSQTTLRAMGATLGTLVFTGGGYMFCCCMIAGTSGGEEGFVVFLAACIPFLLAFPIIAYIELSQGMGLTSSSIEGGMLYAYGIGLIGYTVVSVLLYYHMVTRFDHLAGRTEASPEASAELSPRGI